SPDQVAGRLRYEHPGQRARWVSHESIHTWICALAQGELASAGISLRSQRRLRGRTRSPGARIVV
ncbi:MAG: IS30 family transposase, partial [Pseudonocardiaceae bacterium]